MSSSEHNHPASGKAGTGTQVAIARRWPGLPEPGRYAETVKRAIPFLLLLFVCGCGRNPSIEEVSYTSYSNRYKNNLWIKVNTGKDFFKGREGAFSYKRCNYTFSMATKTNCYTESDMEVSVFPSSSEQSFKAKKAEVRITDVDSHTILVSVSIDDDRIPRLVNGIYTLKVAETTADHVWYRTK